MAPILFGAMNRTMQAEAISYREHLRWAGWQDPTDDDVPRVPEPDPLTSAQARRAWRFIDSSGSVGRARRPGH
jgi:hypothetical protein